MIINHSCCIKLVHLIIFMYEARSHKHQIIVNYGKQTTHNKLLQINGFGWITLYFIVFGMFSWFWITTDMFRHLQWLKHLCVFVGVSDRDFFYHKRRDSLTTNKKRMWSIGLVFWNVSNSVAVESSNKRFVGLVVQMHGDYRDPLAHAVIPVQSNRNTSIMDWYK
jgi:hypothetical protein